MIQLTTLAGSLAVIAIAVAAIVVTIRDRLPDIIRALGGEGSE